MSMTRTEPGFPPPHPGEYLRDDVLPALGVSVSDAARSLGVSRQALHAILRKGHPAKMTPEMALRVGKFTGTGPRIWMKLQTTYDLWHAERKIDTSSIPVGTMNEPT